LMTRIAIKKRFRPLETVLCCREVVLHGVTLVWISEIGPGVNAAPNERQPRAGKPQSSASPTKTSRGTVPWLPEVARGSRLAPFCNGLSDGRKPPVAARNICFGEAAMLN
jgi:hypothetical protein